MEKLVKLVGKDVYIYSPDSEICNSIIDWIDDNYSNNPYFDIDHPFPEEYPNVLG